MERDGVRVCWERYGAGEQTVLLLPTWEIAHSRVWKCQIPYLARRFQVVTFDPRGNGLSGRPREASAHDWHLAACDLAIVQGGLTTAMELAAAKRPFLYFPLKHHFEQNYHVRHRLERYGAGRCMDYGTATPG